MNWAKNEPARGWFDRDCVATRKENNGSENNWPRYAKDCTEKKHYICEIRIEKEKRKELDKKTQSNLEIQFNEAECDTTFVKYTNNIFCKCSNGFPHANEDCPVENAESCESCFDSYILDETTKLCVDACEFDPTSESCAVNIRQFVKYNNQQSLGGSTDELYYKLHSGKFLEFYEKKYH